TRLAGKRRPRRGGPNTGASISCGCRTTHGLQIEGSETSHGLESGAISCRQTERRNPGRHGLGSHLASMSQIDGLGVATLRLVSRMLTLVANSTEASGTPGNDFAGVPILPRLGLGNPPNGNSPPVPML